MKYLLVCIVAIFIISGCGVNTWTAQDLSDWYVSNKTRYPTFYNELYYRGSNKEYHYFICRVFDYYANMKVRRDEIDIDDVRPAIGVFGKPFPGYYAVDPNENYKRIENVK